MDAIKEKLAQHSFRVRIFKNGLICYCAFMIGHVMIICGPTILDLQKLSRASNQDINHIFSASAAGYVVGAFACKFTSLSL